MSWNRTLISRRALTAGLGAAAVGAQLPYAAAQPATYPTRPVRIIFPFAAGGGPDTTLRLVTMNAEKQTGAVLLVENRPGAGGTIGTAQVKQSPPDGYTLMQGSHSTHGAGPILYKNLAYDPIADFEPVTLLFVSRTFLIVPSSLGVNSVKELLELAKRKEGGLTYASPGIGSGGHIGGAMLGQAFGVPATHVPYKGSGATRADVLAGRVDFIFNSVLPYMDDMQSGRVKVLALAHSERFPGLPDIPTMGELGYPNIEIHNWFGIFAPAKTPTSILDTLNKMFVSAANTPQVKEIAEKQGFLIQTTGRSEFGKFVQEDIERLRRMVKEANISI